MKKETIKQLLHDSLVTAGLLALTTGLSFLLFCNISDNLTNIALFYIVGIITVARYTNGYIFGILSSVIGVLCINCFFTFPYFNINFSLSDYPFRFLCMLTLSLITSTTTSHMKRQTQALAAHEKQLLEAEKEKMRANLLRAISHDLRTPLTSILGASASMAEHWENYETNEREELLRNIHDDASWLLNMVENLLSITHIQAADSKLNTTPEIVDEVVAESVTRLKKRLPDAEIHVTLPTEILMIPMDAMLIEQVLINLVENAFLHSHTKRPVELIVEDQSQDVCFRIIDYGIGLDENYQEHIFDGTYSAAASSDVHKGFGIGLSICHSIIMAHHGTILAKNHSDGTEFLFTLPKEEIHE